MTKIKIILHATLLFTFFAFESNSQVQILREFSVLKNHQWHAQKKHADSIANKHKFLKLWIGEDGKATELQWFEHGQPLYYQTENVNASATISSNRTWQEYAFEPGLSGHQTFGGIWDGGYALSNHQEFIENSASRIFQHDEPAYLGIHATHLSGMMIAKGVNVASRGMANAGSIYSYDFNNDVSEMASEAADGLQVSNHSYGPLCGWAYNSSEDMWYWHGNLDISATEDPKFGLYTEISRDMDFIAFHAPEYLIVKSAGNDRNDAPDTQPVEHYIWDGTWKLSSMTHDPDGGANGFDCLSPMAIAKNVLTIGAVEDLPDGYTMANEVRIASFSSFGPTDDGRIKPDLVANGTSVFSCGAEEDTYMELSGTSMSAASITGSVLLLNELQENLQPGVKLKSSTIKALLIHTADESGAYPGPDYQFGWGLANIFKAANLMKENYSGGGKNLLESSLSQGETKSIPISIEENTPQFKATLTWTDPPAEIPPFDLNSSSSNLVNNLDIKIIEVSTGEVYFPWVLDPSNPGNGATKGINNIDNIEQISIDAPEPGAYVIKISHQDNLKDNMQAFSLVLSGLSTKSELFPPKNLAYYTSNNEVHLMWEEGESLASDQYNIYRNGQIITSTSELFFTDQSVQNGTIYSYFITAGYPDEEESIPTNIIQAKPLMPKSMPYSMNCEDELEDWSLKAEISGWRLGDSDSLNCYYLNFSSNAGNFFGIDSYTAGEGVHVSDMAVSPPINLANYENITLAFDYMLITGIYGTTNYIQVCYRQNEAADWVAIADITNFTTDWTNFECSLPPDAAVNGVQLGFKYDDNYKMGMGAGLDNIRLSGSLNISEDISLEAINLPVSPQCYSGNTLDLSITIKNTGNTIIQSGEVFTIHLICTGSDKNINYTLTENLAIGESKKINYNEIINPLPAGSHNLIVSVNWTKDQNISNNTKNKTVVINAIPDIEFIDPPENLCEDSDPVAITVTPAGGTFESDFMTENLFYPSIAGVGDHLIIYTFQDLNNCVNSESITITVEALPTVSFTGLSTKFCVNDDPVTLTGTPPGGSFFGPGIVNTSFHSDLAGVGTHQVEYRYTDAQGCANSAFNQTTVYDITALSLVDLNDAYCINSSPIELQATPEGGAFTIDGEIVDFLDPEQYDAGFIEIIYCFTNVNGCQSDITKEVELYTIPNVSISELAEKLCLIDNEITLEAQPDGGIFTGHLTDENIFNPIIAGVGSYEIIYTYVDEYNCQNADTITIEVVPLPEVSFTGLSSQYCINESSSTLKPVPDGGVFSGSGVSGLNFNPALAGEGLAEVTYLYIDDIGCSNSSVQSTIVYDTANIEMNTLSETYCEDVTSIPLSAIPDGGTFYINNLENDQLFPAELKAGQVEIVYIYENENHCTSTYTTKTEIISLPETSILGVNELYCFVDENYVLTGSPEGGHFVLNDEIISQINPMELGTGSYELTYIYSSTEGCTGIATELFEISTNPEINIKGLEPTYCPNSESVQLEGMPAGGYLDGPGVNESTFSPGILEPGNYIISYSYNLNGCDASTSASTTITEITEVSIEGLQTEYCPADSLDRVEGLPQGGSFMVEPVFEEVPDANSYILSYTYTDENNCSFTDSATFQVYEKPEYTPPENFELAVDETKILDLKNTNLAYVLPGGSTSNKLEIIAKDYKAGENTLPVAIIDEQGCVSDFEIIFSVIGITSVSEISNTAEIKIYPNPTNSYIIIEFPDDILGTKQTVILTDLNGKLIEYCNTIDIISPKIELDVSQFTPGVYLLKIATKDDYTTKKISVIRF